MTVLQNLGVQNEFVNHVLDYKELFNKIMQLTSNFIGNILLTYVFSFILDFKSAKGLCVAELPLDSEVDLFPICASNWR